MANKEKLPWDLIEEILSRVPPKSLVRFRTVSKQWNALCNDKRFIHNHKMTFRFILTTRSKIYSVSIDPKIEVRELTLGIPSLESQILKKYLIDCNGLLLCAMDKGAVVWNPWLTQTSWIEPDVNQTDLQFSGIGYDNGYKTLWFYWKESDPTKALWKTCDLSSGAWKDENDVLKSAGSISTQEEEITLTLASVSLNGTLYWVASYEKTKYLFLLYFDFSSEDFYIYCDLPCGENHNHDVIGLGVFRGERFSLLKQSRLTKKIGVWVTKNKIQKFGGRDVEWMSFMEVSIPNLPDLVLAGFNYQPSYFIDDDKRLVVCSWDEIGRAWIYIMKDNKLISKIHIDLVVDPWPSHCTFFPSLVSVPQGPREEAELHVYKISLRRLLSWFLLKLKQFWIWSFYIMQHDHILVATRDFAFFSIIFFV